jgi:hypothetical protein
MIFVFMHFFFLHRRNFFLPPRLEVPTEQIRMHNNNKTKKIMQTRKKKFQQNFEAKY